MTRLLLSIGAALLLTVGIVHAGPYEDAATAYGSGDYAAALKTFQSLAAQGDARAQFNLGLLYYHGQGVLQDYALARQWYEKAAAQGDADAQYNLGLLYNIGHGVPQE